MAIPAAAPSLSVRAFAELIRLPAYEQLRVLHDQKYPRSEPQSFKIPFYQPALKGIRDYYRSGNKLTALVAARAAATAVGLETRRAHNVRVIDQFEKSKQAKRRLQPKPSPRCSILLAGVEIRLRFDLVALEGSAVRQIFYNLRNAAVDEETSRTTLELAAHVLHMSGTLASIRHLEYVDINDCHSRSIGRIRSPTIKNVQANAKLIKTLWPTV